MKSQQLSIGHAGEHLVMFDLLSKGYKAFMTSEGLNYDIVVDLGQQLIRLQVKTTSKARMMNKMYKTENYCFCVRRCGKGGKRLYNTDEFDALALVVLDEKLVGYLAFNETVNKTLLFRTQYGQYQNHVRARPFLQNMTFDKMLQDIGVFHEDE